MIFNNPINHVYFIGLEDEFNHFCRVNKIKNIKRVEIENALEMALIIKKSKFFLGGKLRMCELILLVKLKSERIFIF